MKAIYKKYFVVLALVWAACLVLLLLAHTLVLAPQKNTKKQIEKEFVQAKKTYEQTSTATQDEVKGRLSKEIESLQDRLKQFVINYEDSANLMLDISQIASQMGVGSFSIRSKDNPETSAPAPSAEGRSGGEHIAQKQIHVSFAAGFNQFASFLNALERNQPVLFVDKFMITRADKDNSGHQVEMDLAVFVRKRQDS